MEPNLNIVKFCLIPAMIAEESYRGEIGKEKIRSVMITNAERLKTNHEFMGIVQTFDFIDESVSYGGNIFQSYDERVSDTSNSIAQGNTASIFNIDIQGDYLLNSSNNLSLFAGLSYRNFSINETTNGFSTNNNVWIRAGIRADLFNWYFDF